MLLPNLSWGWRGKKKGGIRFRLTVGESEAGLVQHLLSRWWRKSEDWVHSWNSKRALPSYRVCSSSFPVTFSETHEYRRTNAHNVVVASESSFRVTQEQNIQRKRQHVSAYLQFRLIHMIKTSREMRMRGKRAKKCHCMWLTWTKW